MRDGTIDEYSDKNKKELKSYHSSKDMSSNLTSNYKNKKQMINMNENKSDNNTKNENNKKEEESISADFLLNDLKIGNNEGNKDNSVNEDKNNKKEEGNYYSLADDN